MNIYRSRCEDCICLVEGDNGEWVCDELNQEVEQVKDCPEGLELTKVASTSLKGGNSIGNMQTLRRRNQMDSHRKGPATDLG